MIYFLLLAVRVDQLQRHSAIGKERIENKVHDKQMHFMITCNLSLVGLVQFVHSVELSLPLPLSHAVGLKLNDEQ
jgi:hypothetical protein